MIAAPEIAERIDSSKYLVKVIEEIHSSFLVGEKSLLGQKPISLGCVVRFSDKCLLVLSWR